MAATLVDGRAHAHRIKQEVRREVARLVERGKAPHLVSIGLRGMPASAIFARSQRRACQSVGIRYTHFSFDEGTSQRTLELQIQALNADEEVTGVLLHAPLPAHLDERALRGELMPRKDVEGLSPTNLGRVFYGEQTHTPCTASGAFELIRANHDGIEGAEAVVVGASKVLGKPLALLLLNAGATTTVCHILTRDLASHTRRAEILVVAAGAHGLVTPEMVRPGATVIDVGINEVTDTDEEGRPLQNERGEMLKRVVGDVAPEVREVAGLLTPVPGGVGPVALAMLLRNTVAALEAEEERSR